MWLPNEPDFANMTLFEVRALKQDLALIAELIGTQLAMCDREIKQRESQQGELF